MAMIFMTSYAIKIAQTILKIEKDYARQWFMLNMPI